MSEMAVALLRGINVGGKNILPMKSLAAMFARAGCLDVRTYIQSGNVVFRSDDAKRIAKVVREEIAGEHGLRVPVVMRTATEMSALVEANPFLPDGIDEALLHVMFLEDEPSREMVAGLDAARSLGDAFQVVGRDVYLHLPNGAARTKLTNAYFDSKLKTVGTQRNWRTVKTLWEMMSGG